MRLVFVGERESTLACLALFPAVGGLIGFLSGLGGPSLVPSSVAGVAVGLLFWSLIAVQDLRLVRS